MTWIASSDGGASSSTGTPILPPISTSRPPHAGYGRVSAVVVDLPLAPVIAMKRARGAQRGALAAEQFDVADDLDAGRFGERHGPMRLRDGSAARRARERRTAKSRQSAAARSTTAMPAARARSRAPSHCRPRPRHRRRRRRARARSKGRSLRARTARPCGLRSSGRRSCSPQLQRRQADHRQHESDDPEAHDDLRLRPAELFEMMMDRRHAKDALAGQLERGDLDDDRQAPPSRTGRR